MKLNTLKLFSPAIFLLLVSGLFYSCNSVYTPKRRGYFKIDFPPHQYQLFDQKGYPYTFEYPVYASIVQDTSFFEARPENPWWINIDFPRFNARIYISYKEIGPPTDQGSVGHNRASEGYDRGGARDEAPTKGSIINGSATKGKFSPNPKEWNSFDKLREDAYKMTFKHTYKASSIDDSVIRTPAGVSGIFFKVGGNAATAQQFYLTDTTKHFLRGALYFDVAPNEDSLGIVNRFLQADMTHLINTFHWTHQTP